MSSDKLQQPDSRPAIAESAAAWLARRDRGLTAAEQDDYMQWLAADPRHVEAINRHAGAFQRMMKLYEWQPGAAGEPNPDLFAPRRRFVTVRASAWFAIAAAVMLVAGWYFTRLPGNKGAAAPSAYLRVNERVALPDASVVELKDGSRIAVEFSAGERRVRLTGEAHFQVTSDPKRPFLVDAGGVVVRAVGTAFNVRMDPDAVQIVVTEGTVRVQPPAEANVATVAAEPAAVSATVTAGQHAIVSLIERTPPRVNEMGEAEVAEALEWQAPRLQFFETPLEIAIGEFNARNRVQITIADPELSTVPIGGTFRVDNVDGFVRLLEVTLELKVIRGEQAIVLQRSRP